MLKQQVDAMLLPFFIAVSFMLPGRWVIRMTRLRMRSIGDRIISSYVLSLGINLSLLLVGAIFNAFDLAVILLFMLVMGSAGFLLLDVIARLKTSSEPLVSWTEE